MSSPWPPPVPGTPPPPPGHLPWQPEVRAPFPTLPLRAAVYAAFVTVAVLIGNRVVILALADNEWPVAVYIVLSALIAYAPLVVLCWWISRHWGTGSLRDDIGLSFRPVDLGWGPLAWLSCLVAQGLLAAVVLGLGVPFTSNTDGLEAGASNRGYVISLLVLAVIAAPIVEEMVFRGVVLRGLASRTPLPVAVVLQGITFGAVHIDPSFGWGNLGLVMILSGVGMVLGGTAALVRRLAPSMMAHAILNGVALTLVLTGVVDT